MKPINVPITLFTISAPTLILSAPAPSPRDSSLRWSEEIVEHINALRAGGMSEPEIATHYPRTIFYATAPPPPPSHSHSHSHSHSGSSSSAASSSSSTEGEIFTTYPPPDLTIWSPPPRNPKTAEKTKPKRPSQQKPLAHSDPRSKDGHQTTAQQHYSSDPNSFTNPLPPSTPTSASSSPSLPHRIFSTLTYPITHLFSFAFGAAAPCDDDDSDDDEDDGRVRVVGGLTTAAAGLGSGGGHGIDEWEDIDLSAGGSKKKEKKNRSTGRTKRLKGVAGMRGEEIRRG